MTLTVTITLITLILAIIILACLGTSLIMIFIMEGIQAYCSNREIRRRKQEVEKAYQKYQQQKRKRECHIKDREMYPLFYWKESTKEEEIIWQDYW